MESLKEIKILNKIHRSQDTSYDGNYNRFHILSTSNPWHVCPYPLQWISNIFFAMISNFFDPK